MIEYLKIEITPTNFADTRLRELKIIIQDSRTGEFGSTQIIEPDDLMSFFDQIWERAGKEIQKHLKESSPVPLQAPESPVSG